MHHLLQQLPVVVVPALHAPVVRAGEKPPLAAIKRHRRDARPGGPPRRRDEPPLPRAAVHVPQVHVPALVRAHGDVEPVVVRAGDHRSVVALVLLRLQPLTPKPEPRHARDKPPPRRVVRHRRVRLNDARAHLVLDVVHERLRARVRAEVPHLDHLIRARGDDAVGGLVHRDERHRRLVPRQRRHHAARARVPQHDVAAHAARREQTLARAPRHVANAVGEELEVEPEAVQRRRRRGGRTSRGRGLGRRAGGRRGLRGRGPGPGPRPRVSRPPVASRRVGVDDDRAPVHRRGDDRVQLLDVRDVRHPVRVSVVHERDVLRSNRARRRAPELHRLRGRVEVAHQRANRAVGPAEDQPRLPGDRRGGEPRGRAHVPDRAKLSRQLDLAPRAKREHRHGAVHRRDGDALIPPGPIRQVLDRGDPGRGLPGVLRVAVSHRGGVREVLGVPKHPGPVSAPGGHLVEGRDELDARDDVGVRRRGGAAAGREVVLVQVEVRRRIGVRGRDRAVVVVARRGGAHEEHEVGELVPVHAAVAVGVDLHEELPELRLRERAAAKDVREVLDELVELDAVVPVLVRGVELLLHLVKRVEVELVLHGRGHLVLTLVRGAPDLGTPTSAPRRTEGRTTTLERAPGIGRRGRREGEDGEGKRGAEDDEGAHDPVRAARRDVECGLFRHTRRVFSRGSARLARFRRGRRLKWAWPSHHDRSILKASPPPPGAHRRARGARVRS